jgi:hypothetical protein
MGWQGTTSADKNCVVKEGAVSWYRILPRIPYLPRHVVRLGTGLFLKKLCEYPCPGFFQLRISIRPKTPKIRTAPPRVRGMVQRQK